MSFYIFNNFISDENYLVISSINTETDTLINKLRTNSISKKEYSELVKLYDLPKDNIDNLKGVFKYDIRSYTILDIKKLLFVLIDIPIEKQHLWYNNEYISDELKNSIISRFKYEEITITFDLENLPLQLGYRYENDHGTNYYNPILNGKITIEKDASDRYIDMHSELLSKEISIIYFIDYDIFKSNANVNNANTLVIEQLFFPNLRSLDGSKMKLNLKEYKEIYDDINKIIISYNSVNLEKNNEKFSITVNDSKISNLIMYSNINYYNPITNLEEIFNRLEPEKDIIFIKFRNFIRNDFYKINKNGIYNFKKKADIKNNFNDYNEYLINFEHNKYDPIIVKKQIESWKNNINLPREYAYQNKNEELIIKINMEDLLPDMFCTLVIHYNGMIEIKLLETIKEYFIDKNQILRQIVPKINSILNKFKNIKLIEKDNIDYVNINFSYKIKIDNEKQVSLLDIKKTISKYYYYGYIIDNDENNITLKFKINKFYNSYANIKHYYKKLRDSNSKLEVSDFKELWINDSKYKFNLSSADSIDLQTKISEEIEIKDTEIIDSIDILISNVKEPNEFYISILNSNDIHQNETIHEFIETIIYDILFKKSSKSSKSPINIVEMKEEIKTQQLTFNNANNMGIEINYNSNSNNNSNNSQLNNGVKQVNDSNNNDNGNGNESNIVIETKMPKTIRAYRDSIRKRDKALLNYKTTKTHKLPYTKKCGAVDMRQPIILTKLELETIKKRNIDGYNKIKDTIINWGSSSKKLHYYICPRVWCIRCKMVLTEKQLIDNKGVCKFCPGKIIKDTNVPLKKNDTILIRKGKSNNYWGYSKIPKDFLDDIKGVSKVKEKEYKFKWNILLKGSEKKGYPSLLDPKIHPLNMCMPCCNGPRPESVTNPIIPKNIDKCLKYNVSYVIKNNKIRLKDLVNGNTIQLIDKDTTKIILNKSDKILLLNKDKTNGFYEITFETPIEITRFSKLNVEFINGISVNDMNSGVVYSIYNDNGIYKIHTKTEKQVQNYISGSDKFPLNIDKYGILPIKLDKFFNGSQTILDKGVMKKGYTIFRKGIDQQDKHSKNSFLSVLSDLYSILLEDYINKLIEYLTPDIFVSLNNGEIFKYFSEKRNINNEPIFIKWIDTYPSLSNFNYDLDDDNHRKNLYNIYISMENYKKYICDLNILKDFNLLIDLVSRYNNNNIIIVEETKKHNINVLNPINDDSNNIYNIKRDSIILYKHGDLYEPLYEINNTSISEKTNFLFTNGKYKNKINKIIELIIQNNNNEPSYYDIENVDTIIINNYFKGVGVITNSGLVIHTLPFNMDFAIKYVHIHKLYKIQTLSIIDIINKYKELAEIKLDSLVVDNDIIHSILTDKGNYIPVNSESYVKDKYPTIKNILYEKYSEDIEDALINEQIIEDERRLFNNNHDLEKNMYNNLKLELSYFFKHDKTNLGDNIEEFIRNKVITIDIKRKELNGLIKSIITEFTDFDKPKIENDGACQSRISSKCKSNKCKLGSKKLTKQVSFDKESYDLKFNECKFILNKSNYNLFYSAIVEEILKYYNKRNIILSGSYTLPYSKKMNENTLLLNGLNYLEKITELYKMNRYLYANKYYNNKISKNNIHSTKKIPKFKVLKSKSKVIKPLTKIPKFKVLESKPKLSNQNEIQPSKNANQNQPSKNANQNQPSKNANQNQPSKNNQNEILDINADLKDIYGNDIKINPKSHKAGKCIFPFNYKANWPQTSFTGKQIGMEYKDTKKQISVNDCLPSSKKKFGYWCPTEINKDRTMSKYGFCKSDKYSKKTLKNNVNDNTQKDRYAVDFMIDKRSKKRKPVEGPDLKEGKCKFPFKKKTIKGRDITSCVKSKYGDWCATELNINPIMKKWGRCIPEGMTIEEYKKQYPE